MLVRSHMRYVQRGLTLIELMIGMTISLVVLAALTGLFVNSMRGRDDMERSNYLVENGRYALQLLASDFELAGYYSEFDHAMAAALPPPPAIGRMDFPADLPAPCAADLASLDLTLPFPIQGYDNTPDVTINCIADRIANTDVIIIRRLSTCVAGTANCADVAGAPYFQASKCNGLTELLSPDSDDWFLMHTNVAALVKTERDCVTVAERRRFRTHIYFLANNDRAGDGVPTLKRAELAGANFVITPLVNGVENMQFEYGIDTTNDGVPDAYTSTPSTFGGCLAAACRMNNWRNVVTVKLSLLSRSLSAGRGLSSAKSYNLGRDAAGAQTTVGPFSDGYKRHVFQTTAVFKNIAGQRR